MNLYSPMKVKGEMNQNTDLQKMCRSVSNEMIARFVGWFVFPENGEGNSRRVAETFHVCVQIIRLSENRSFGIVPSVCGCGSQ